MMTRRLKRARQQCFSSEVKGGTLAASQASEASQASQEDYFTLEFTLSSWDLEMIVGFFLNISQSLFTQEQKCHIYWSLNLPKGVQVASSYQSKKSTDGFKGGRCMWVGGGGGVVGGEGGLWNITLSGGETDLGGLDDRITQKITCAKSSVNKWSTQNLNSIFRSKKYIEIWSQLRY